MLNHAFVVLHTRVEPVGTDADDEVYNEEPKAKEDGEHGKGFGVEKVGERLADAKSSFALDAVYLGDDGRPSGNDREAFEAIGPEHSILVANPASTDIIPFLTTRTIGGLVDGTRRVLEYVNGVIREHPHQEIFTQANLAALVRAASQA